MSVHNPWSIRFTKAERLAQTERYLELFDEWFKIREVEYDREEYRRDFDAMNSRRRYRALLDIETHVIISRVASDAGAARS